MNSRERVLATLSPEGCPDRIAAGPFAGYYAASHSGIPMGEYITDGRKIAEAQLRLFEDLGHDILVTAADTYYIAEAFGLEVDIHHDTLPTARGPRFNDVADMLDLEIPDPEKDGRMPVYLEALSLLRDKVGDEVAIRGTGTGPFSLAAYLLGPENFLLTLMDIESGEAAENAERDMRRILDIMTDTTLRFVMAQARLGADILYVGDSMASLNMISPAIYRKWVWPCHKRLFTEMKKQLTAASRYSMIHMCGDNSAILADMAQTGVDLIEIDSSMELGMVAEILGGRTAFIGNIDPVHVLAEGTPGDVLAACEAALDSGVDNGRFILGTGCFVCPETPLENLQVMVKSAHHRKPRCT